MASKQEKALAEKMKGLGYVGKSVEMKPGEEDVLMLHVQDCLICGVAYALEMPDDALKALIDETVQVGGD
jgi:hypothetical protein